LSEVRRIAGCCLGLGEGTNPFYSMRVEFRVESDGLPRPAELLLELWPEN
jgi:hypothetical protein